MSQLLLLAASEDFEPLISNDAVVFGLLMVILAAVFVTSNSQWAPLRLFYKCVPMLLLCYFLPSLLTTFHIVNPGRSGLGTIATRVLLPASLVLLTLSVDLREILRLGPKALIMFLTGTIGVVMGGPLAILIVSLFAPSLVGGAEGVEVWRGLSTVAGSWIGGGANQLAMKEIFLTEDSSAAKDLFTVMIAVDVIVAEIWMMFLLLGVGQHEKIDRLFGADASSIERLKEKMETFSRESAKIPTATDLMTIAGIAFGITAASHCAADWIAPTIGEFVESVNDPSRYAWMLNFSLHKEFFWLVVLATAGGVLLSFTPARKLEGAGASKVGTVFIFILVAVIGLNMNIRALADHPGLFLVGGIWMAIHVALLVAVGYFIKAPYFFLAVGSKANIGGAASAPVVAAAFHPSLAPVGVLLAVLGYVLGTYAAYLCALMMQAVS